MLIRDSGLFNIESLLRVAEQRYLALVDLHHLDVLESGSPDIWATKADIKIL